MVASLHKADDIKHTNLSYFYEYYLQLKPKSMLKDHVPIYEVQTSFFSCLESTSFTETQDKMSCSDAPWSNISSGMPAQAFGSQGL